MATPIGPRGGQDAMKVGGAAPLRWAAARALRIARYVFNFGRGAPARPGAAVYTGCRNGVLALIWTVAALSPVEAGVVHILVRLWSPTAAVVVTALSALSVLYLLALANALRLRPTLVSECDVHVRSGLDVDERIAWSDVASVARLEAASAETKATTLRAAALSRPNVRLALAAPRAVTGGWGRPRTVTCVDLYLDDPAGFCAQAAARLGAAAGRAGAPPGGGACDRDAR